MQKDLLRSDGSAVQLDPIRLFHLILHSVMQGISDVVSHPRPVLFNTVRMAQQQLFANVHLVDTLRVPFDFPNNSYGENLSRFA